MKRHAHRQALWEEIPLIPHSYKNLFYESLRCAEEFSLLLIWSENFLLLQKLYSLWKAVQNISDVNFKMQFSTDKEKKCKKCSNNIKGFFSSFFLVHAHTSVIFQAVL